MIKLGLWIAIISSIPLLLYLVLGTADENPVGLGLLSAAGALLGSALIGFGTFLSFVRRRS